MALVESRYFIENHFLPFRTKILDEEPMAPQDQNQPEDDSQAGTQQDSTQEDQEDSSSEEQSPDSCSEDGDDTSVSTRPWTRSQGPPPALTGTQSLSKCCLNAPPSLLQEQVGARMARPTGYTNRLVGWASSLLEELHFW